MNTIFLHIWHERLGKFVALPRWWPRGGWRFVTVSIDDLGEVYGTNWILQNVFLKRWNVEFLRFRARIKQRHYYLSRRLMAFLPGNGNEVDHINGDALCNRRENLRLVTRAENIRNRDLRKMANGFGNDRDRFLFENIGFTAMLSNPLQFGLPPYFWNDTPAWETIAMRPLLSAVDEISKHYEVQIDRVDVRRLRKDNPTQLRLRG